MKRPECVRPFSLGRESWSGKAGWKPEVERPARPLVLVGLEDSRIGFAAMLSVPFAVALELGSSTRLADSWRWELYCCCGGLARGGHRGGSGKQKAFLD